MKHLSSFFRKLSALKSDTHKLPKKGNEAERKKKHLCLMLSFTTKSNSGFFPFQGTMLLQVLIQIYPMFKISFHEFN